MCSRYEPPSPTAFAPFDLPSPDFEYSAECFPARLAPFLANDFRDAFRPGCFGIVPHWGDIKLAKRTYNSRSETASRLPSFRHAWKQRQLAVIPVQRFYEPNYETGKAQWWAIERKDGKPFGLAGLWERKLDAPDITRWSFTMLTMNAEGHPLMQRFHKPGDEKRSVVVLDDDEWDAWLDADEERDVRSFIRLFDPDLMVASPREKKASTKSRKASPPAE